MSDIKLFIKKNELFGDDCRAATFSESNRIYKGFLCKIYNIYDNFELFIILEKYFFPNAKKFKYQNENCFFFTIVYFHVKTSFLLTLITSYERIVKKKVCSKLC